MQKQPFSVVYKDTSAILVAVYYQDSFGSSASKNLEKFFSFLSIWNAAYENQKMKFLTFFEEKQNRTLFKCQEGLFFRTGETGEKM